MRKMHETAMVEVYVEGLWCQCHMSQVDVGDLFRIRSPDGKLREGAWRCTAIPNIPCQKDDGVGVDGNDIG